MMMMVMVMWLMMTVGVIQCDSWCCWSINRHKQTINQSNELTINNTFIE